MRMESKLISLNLIYDYPVKWSKYKVLRDLVQNFYDAVRYQEWNERFSWWREGDQLGLEAKNVSFSYDWLIHIGASTKREKPGEYAGYFGEGFKIASLCALRDYGWQIEMASQDWSLVVVTSQVEVDGRFLTSLAYRVRQSEAVAQNTTLRIHSFSAQDDQLLQSVLCSFFYLHNPLFGEEIWSSHRSAIFYRSGLPKPAYYPATHNDSGAGIIFAGYQALGSFDYPLIFCAHDFRRDDRERNYFFKMDVIKVIQQVVEELPPEAAAKVLQILKNRWYDNPRKQYDFETWHSIIRTLALRVAVSAEQKKAWHERYPNLLVARPIKRSDVPNYNKRKQALAWVRSAATKYQLVQTGFATLGYAALEEVCEKAEGFAITREPDEEESKRIQLLEAVSQLLLAGFLKDVELPKCKIIKYDAAAWRGMANCIPLKRPITISPRMHIRYRLSHIALKRSLLIDGDFGAVLSTYLHEIAHMFGNEGSASFSKALTELLEITLSNTRVIEFYREQWQKVGV